MVETNLYYYDYIDGIAEGASPDPGVTEAEIFMFLALTILMQNGVREK